ncbi:hypothetical protein CDCA_CDCA02G0624 [Cyanidium caldarium]|uniref:Ribosome maturation factor RimP n=1 Tax=Cyanidium caldarium TaxID=2771 RepID=A0AAV9IQK1_CYACA|nr:hypothetical protein CDCA_CDCA02G0624 [Cyanidium caldarium]
MQVDSTPKAISSTTPPSSTTSPSAASSGPVPPLTPTTSWTERALYVAREALRPALLIESITFHDATRTLRIQLSTQATADDCETVARAIQNDEGVDLPHRIPDDVVLEVTTPGVSETLTASHEFAAFKSFPVTVTLHEAHRKHGKQVQGTLMGRNDTHVSVNLHGRIVKLARGNVAEVRLQPATDGDEEESA